jgi:hypothetical protein
VCRISAELAATDSDSLVYYGNETKPPFKIWCLDDPQGNQPTAELNGLAVSITPSGDTIDEIFKKRYAGDDFDQNLSHVKRRRTNDLSPYTGLTKKDRNLQILREFLPQSLAEKLVEKVPPRVLRETLKVVRSLEQEYRYMLLDRMLRNEVYKLPALWEFEELERAALVNQAEKMEVFMSFVAYAPARPNNSFRSCGFQIIIVGFTLKSIVTDPCSGRLIIDHGIFVIHGEPGKTKPKDFSNALLSSCQANFTLITKHFLQLLTTTGDIVMWKFGQKSNDEMAKDLVSLVEHAAGEGIKEAFPGDARYYQRRDAGLVSPKCEWSFLSVSAG